MDVIDQQPEVVDPRQSLVNDPEDQEEDDPHQLGHVPVDVDDSKNLDDEEEDEVENRSEGSSPNDDEVGGGFSGTEEEEMGSGSSQILEVESGFDIQIDEVQTECDKVFFEAETLRRRHAIIRIANCRYS
jgi:hypothetical protein